MCACVCVSLPLCLFRNCLSIVYAREKQHAKPTSISVLTNQFAIFLSISEKPLHLIFVCWSLFCSWNRIASTRSHCIESKLMASMWFITSNRWAKGKWRRAQAISVRARLSVDVCLPLQSVQVYRAINLFHPINYWKTPQFHTCIHINSDRAVDDRTECIS